MFPLKKAFFLFACLAVVGQMRGQKTGGGVEKNLGMDFECKEELYFFKILGKTFSHKDKVYICPNNLDATVEIIDAQGNPIPFDVQWVGADSPNSNYSATLLYGHFNNGKCVVEATFLDQEMEEWKLYFKGWYPVLEIENAVAAKFEFDDNKKPLYPSYNTTPSFGIPWKFLETTELDDFQASSKPGKSYYAMSNFEVNDPDLIVVPGSMNQKDQNINIHHVGISNGFTTEVNFIGCGSDPEVKIFVGDRIDKEINFVYLCNTPQDYPSPAQQATITAQVNQLITEANDILNKAGHYISVASITFEIFNYDINNNGVMSLGEQVYTHNFFAGSPIFYADYLVFLVPDLGEDGNQNIVRGRATSANPPVNSLAIDVVNVSGGDTMAHEIGHGCFGLSHPDDPNNPHHTPFQHNKNFMYFTSTNRENIIRSFQYQIIHTIR